ncbi:hypothetical protein [Acidovorax sp. Root217]|uniref:hypothetical protein n=1 Tax=Acidovorax sp. Root217 TaxID=1736492 RepID=UPI00070B3FF9|nr:hypothetical protein [Acidovorax sp. Root217]KRC26071.1 hypothetical protein ASE31_18505 [Acidovorax sp. Root217]
MRRQIWRTTLAALLASASLGAGAGMSLPITAVELDGVSMAKLRGSIALPRPDLAITELLTYVYPEDILRKDSPRSAPYASFSTEVFETGPGYQRKRVGNCKFEQAQWTCRGHDMIAFDNGIAAGVSTTMPTAMVLRILNFAQQLAADERKFFITSYDNGDRFSVTVGDGCTSTMSLRRKGETFEVVFPEWRNARVCH